MSPTRLGICLVALSALPSISCFGVLPTDAPEWRDQLQPDTACYDVNIGDGLDEDTTQEVNDLFDCLNWHGHVSSMQPMRDAFDNSTRSGVPIGIELATMANHMDDVEVDPFAFATVALDLVQAEDRPIEEFFDVVLELSYGVPAKEVRSSGFNLQSSVNLQAGVLAPLDDVAPEVCSVLLDDDLDTIISVGEGMSDPEMKRWIWTFDSMARSTNPAVVTVRENLLEHAGEMLVATRDPSNDVWSGASGNSLRDLLAGEVIGDPAIVQIAPAMESILGDNRVRSNIHTTFIEMHDDGIMQDLAGDTKWFASTNLQGSSLQTGQTSGLAAFLRLLSNTNRPMTCSVDLGFLGSLDIDLGNMAVTILNLLADQDPYALQDLTGFLGDLLDFPLSEWMIDLIVDSEACSALNQEVFDDLDALALLSDPQAEALIVFVIELLNDLKYGNSNHLQEIADVVTVLNDMGKIPQTEEVLRDVGDEPAMDDVVGLIDILAQPNAHGLSVPDGGRPYGLSDMLTNMHGSFELQDGLTGYERMEPLMTPVLEADGTWVAIGNAGNVLADGDSQLSRALDLIPPLIDADPELTLLDQLGPLLSDRQLAGPLLRVAENPRISGAMLTPVPMGDDPEVPLAFVSRLIRNGAVDDLLRIMDMMLVELDRLQEEQDSAE